MDIVLNYREAGAGPHLILLHGNGESSGYFVHQIECFREHFHVLAIDTRGHGGSPRGEKPFTLCQFADDLYDFMVENGIKKANILGFSDGGNIALLFALKHREMVEKLVLNGANLNPRGVKRRVQIPIEIGYRVASVFSKRSPKAEKNAQMLGLMVQEPDIPPEELQNLYIPVLVAAGTKDVILESHTRLIQKSLPDAQLAILPGNHFVANRNPDAFNRAVLRFLQGPSKENHPR